MYTFDCTTNRFHLVSCAGSLARYVQRKLSVLDIWCGSFVSTRDELRKGVSLCEHWVTVCETLTSHFWKRFPLHPWESDTFTPTVTVQLAARLEEVRLLQKKSIFFLKFLSKNYTQLVNFFVKITILRLSQAHFLFYHYRYYYLVKMIELTSIIWSNRMHLRQPVYFSQRVKNIQVGL